MNVQSQSPLWRRIARTLGRQLFTWAENNDDPNIERNGEQWLLRSLLKNHVRLGANHPFVLVDAGANRGEYSRNALEIAHSAGCAIRIHMFEPAVQCVDALRLEFADQPGVQIVDAALGDEAREATLYGESGSSQASLMKRVGAAQGSGEAVVRLTCLGSYLTTNAVPCVNLLKLDVEGSELAALRGLGERLNPGSVNFIQFEYGGAALDAGTSLRDLYKLLLNRGYVVAKLFPNAIEIRDYRPWMEHYAYANYVALSPGGMTARDSSNA